jgi:DNA-binding FrmR family transcriptional regulator
VSKKSSINVATSAHALEDQEQLNAIIHRMKRAHGQLGAVVRMLEDGRNCEEVVHQIAAVNKAINTAAFTLISSSLKECLTGEQSNSEEITGKLQKLFLSLA